MTFLIICRKGQMKRLEEDILPCAYAHHIFFCFSLQLLIPFPKPALLVTFMASTPLKIFANLKLTEE